MATISGLQALINAAKSGGVVTWSGNLETILNTVKTLIKERGILSFDSDTSLSGLSNSEGGFAMVKGVGLYYYVYSATTPTNPYKSADVANYYWVLICNYKNLPLALASLSDANIAGLQVGQAIFYNGSNGKWENSDFLKSTIVTPIHGQYLRYNIADGTFCNSGSNIQTLTPAGTYNISDTADVVLLSDTTGNYSLTIPATNLWDGKILTIAYTATVSGHTVAVIYNSITIFTLSGSTDYTHGRYSVTLMYNINNNTWYPISTS